MSAPEICFRLRSLYLIATLLLAGVASYTRLARSQTLPASLQSEFDTGVAAVEAGRLDDAEKAFQEVLFKGGKAAFVYNNLGIVYQMKGDQTAAIKQFREAIRLQPDYAAPRILLGASLLAVGKPEEAAVELERAVEMQPDELAARLQLARAYRRTGRYAEAVAQYQALHSLRPQDAELFFQWGRTYSEQAEWCFRQIRKIDSKSARLYEALGQNYRLQGHLDLAESAYRRAAAAAPKLPGIHLELARIYLEQGQAKQAQKEIDQELTIVPESIAAQELAKKAASEAAK
jgi:tetratricopeptide (TPR) repeat protein